MSLSKPGLLERFARGPEEKTPPIPRIWNWLLLPVWVVCGAVEAGYAVYRPTEQAVQREFFRKSRARLSSDQGHALGALRYTQADIDAAVLAEREACARVCEHRVCGSQGFAGPSCCILPHGHGGAHKYGVPATMTSKECAAAIRERSNVTGLRRED